MRAFISHNKADKVSARFLATCFVEQGEDVWFDEWEIGPGDSITGGVERGLSECDVFVLLWSAAAGASKWVGAELGAYLKKRIENGSIRIIPVMLDDTPLPMLVADYRGFKVTSDCPLDKVAVEITGKKPGIEVARLMLDHLLGLGLVNPVEVSICPECGSMELERSSEDDYDGGYVLCIRCRKCHWRA